MLQMEKLVTDEAKISKALSFYTESFITFVNLTRSSFGLNVLIAMQLDPLWKEENRFDKYGNAAFSACTNEFWLLC